MGVEKGVGVGVGVMCCSNHPSHATYTTPNTSTLQSPDISILTLWYLSCRSIMRMYSKQNRKSVREVRSARTFSVPE